MLLLRPPGVYPPQSDTWLLARALRTAAIGPGARVLDLCTGTGALALTAVRTGAAEVTAVDVNPWAVLAARCNAALRRAPVRVLCGDLTEPVAGAEFDVVVANPPYVAAPGGHRPSRGGPGLAWDAGPDGRALLDRLCAAAPRCLAAGGVLLLVQSALSGAQRTLALLRGAGLKATVVDRATIPFGPVMRARADRLRERGLVAVGQSTEELVVIRADRPLHP